MPLTAQRGGAGNRWGTCGVRRVLIRAAYAFAPLALLGTVALISGHGRHRVAVLALAVVMSVFLGSRAGETNKHDLRRERSITTPGPASPFPALPAARSSLQDATTPLAQPEQHSATM